MIVLMKFILMMIDDRWGGQSGSVFSALEGDFMKPRIDEVRKNITLLLTGERNIIWCDFCFIF